MERPPQQESRLDSLVKKAAQESAENLAKDPKIAAIGASTQRLQSRAQEEIEYYIAKAREESRYYAEKLTESKTYIEEKAAAYGNDPRIQRVNEDMLRIDKEIIEKLQKALTDTMGNLFASLGISEATAKEIITEIAEQESKVVAFPKK